MRLLSFASGLIGLLFTSSAQAQIGKTPKQCQVRYGKPVHRAGGTTFYEKDDLSVAITFARGVADSIRFRRLKQDAAHVPLELTNRDLETLLNANGAEHGWLGDFEDATKVVWSTEDNLYLAIYSLPIHELSIRARATRTSSPPGLTGLLVDPELGGVVVVPLR